MANSRGLANLQSALNTAGKRSVTVPSVARPVAQDVTPAAPVAVRQANREGKVNIAAWLDPGFKDSLRLVQARRRGSIQELMEEALNDLFAKYDVPQISKSDVD